MVTAFDPERDDERYARESAQVLTAFSQWLSDRGSDPGLTGDAEMFLDWRFGYSTGEIYAYRSVDLHEFLIEWCPRKWSAQPADWLDLPEAISLFLEFLGESGRWEGSSTLLGNVQQFIDAVTPEFLEAMGDPKNYGMAKSLFMGPALSGADIDLDDPASIQRAMDRFNALPFDQRKELTDPGFAQRVPAPSRMTLAPVIAPSTASVRASVARSELFAQVSRLAEFFGEKGRPLTQHGNVKLADAKVLVELLGTGDTVDPSIGDRVHKTASVLDLPQLSYIIAVARQAGAIRQVKNSMLAVKAWTKRDEVTRATSMVMAALEVGVQGHRRHFNEWFEDLADFLDASTPLWLAPNLSTGQPIDVDDIVALTVRAAALTVGAYRPRVYADDAAFARLIKEDIESIVRMLVAAGVVDVHEDAFQLTALGRHAMIDLLPRIGYEFDLTGPLDTATARQLLDAIATLGDAQIDAIWADWQPEMTDSSKAQQIVAVLTAPTTAIDRVHGLELLGRMSAAAEPYIRTLIGGPLTGHALMWLETHGFAEGAPRQIEGLAPLVDVLWLALQDLGAEGLATMFDHAVPPDTQLDVMTNIWRLEMSELAEVLDALGRAHPRKEIAKAARKSLMQHRSLMANRRRP